MEAVIWTKGCNALGGAWPKLGTFPVCKGLRVKETGLAEAKRGTSLLSVSGTRPASAEATKALQGVDSGALAAQYRQCSACAKGLKSMEMNTKESAFNMFCPFCWFLSPAVTANGILTLQSKSKFRAVENRRV